MLELLAWLLAHGSDIGKALLALALIFTQLVGVASVVVRWTPTPTDDKWLAPVMRVAEWVSLALKRPAVVGKGTKTDQLDVLVDALQRGDTGELQAIVEAVQSYKPPAPPHDTLPEH
ncbi:MAG: hypothetical protein H6747_08985 [Deltaproteobacteria bacterium]|nr:hypothetical protein [Deltaproteobacteria bacterium]